MQRFNYDYDTDNDDLFLFNPKSRSRASVELGNIIFDFNSRKNLVGIQLMNASKLLKDMVDDSSIKDMKEFLKSLKGCNVEIKDNQDILIVKFLLISDMQEIQAVLSVPKITESSSTVARV